MVLKLLYPTQKWSMSTIPLLQLLLLPDPVKFGEMGAAPGTFLDVQIVMMLANADPDEQVKTLRKMVDLFDEPDSLDAIMNAKTADEVVKILKENY